jgi:uncharacterized membrane protein
MKNSKIPILIIQISGLLGLVISISHFSRYFGVAVAPLEALCHSVSHGGCEDIKQSEFSHLFGMPVPLLVVFFFLGIILLTPLKTRVTRTDYLRITAGLAWSAGGILIAILFFYISIFVLETLCSYCLLEDICMAGVMTGYIMLAGKRRVLRPFRTAKTSLCILTDGRTPAGTAVFARLAISLSIALMLAHVYSTAQIKSKKRKPEFPCVHEIEAHAEKQAFIDISLPPGTIEIGTTDSLKWKDPNLIHVVEFTDFQCPFCLASLQHLFPLPIELRENIRYSIVHLPLSLDCNPGIKKTLHKRACDFSKIIFYCTLINKEKEAIGILIKKKNIPYKSFMKRISRGLGISDLKERLKEKSGEVDKLLESHVSLGNQLNLKGTPKFFVNGKRIPSYSDERIFLKYFDYLHRNQSVQ